MATIFNGVSWFDDRGETVNAHGACVVEEHGTYYLFGEYKTDDRNMFNGFACYSSRDLATWHFERLVLPRQSGGRLGPDRVGERVKVMRCPATGKYVMLMHSDNLEYKDPMTLMAVSDTIDGEYQIVGPLLCDGRPIRMWDIGTFQDHDGTGYLLIHGGHIYRLSDDYLSAELVQPDTLEPYGESPAMAHVGDTYYLIMSNLTGWDRNDNFYLTAPDPSGPWTYRGNVAPQGTCTWDSQSSFVFPLHTGHGDRLIYMGDRWSFPHQASCASQVWLPLRFGDDVASVRDGSADIATDADDARRRSADDAALADDAGVDMLDPVDAPTAMIGTATESGAVAGRPADFGRPLLPRYADAWDSATGEPVALRGETVPLSLFSNRHGDSASAVIEIADTADDTATDEHNGTIGGDDAARLVLIGPRSKDGGVGRVVIRRIDGGADHVADRTAGSNVGRETGIVARSVSAPIVCQLFDCYAQSAYSGPLFVSKPLPAGRYEVTVQALGETGLWIEKNGTRRGGADSYVNVWHALLL
ncbi:hypothetical protein [Bifidobacterium biavatii]|uniref:Glycosyl hydrolase family 43 protein n=1 Tax=Bifidobacterium biavatii DSM 23969 TaxID=1437608 RepID=A0A087A1M1_9BIFI|nr:hypothetical protein [Bifidobacterium biavatii]KFI52671.1 glycosyl hydrolase family 43 protein [Bifidobacterium biavatii DSM 23969]